MDELIPTKIAPPIWMGDQIRRDALLARLDGALDRRLTLIHAPAGYGKTSLLAQWRDRIDALGTLVAWLSLERDDADPARLARYIALALNGPEPAGDEDDDDIVPANMPARAALSVIINRLARETRRVVLILDDWHCAESGDVADFLQSLIRLAPRNCHFIIASRDTPRLGQSILAAEEQLLDFTSEDLKFSLPEAEAMLARADGADLAGDYITSLVERTEGWPIALQLTFLSLKRGMDRRLFVGGFTGSSAELARYLSEQVLMSLPSDTQEILIRTALLDRVTGEAVNLLCDRQDGWLILERLEQQGVLLTPLTAERDAYRYHQLFAEYLRERLARGDAQQWRLLHRRLADWYAGHGDTAEAVRHAIEADDNAQLANIVEAASGWRLIPQGQQGLVERALATLPAAAIEARPRLVLARVYLEIKCGRMHAARIAYDRLVARAKNVDTSPDLWTEIRVVGDILLEYENVPMPLEDLLAREALLRTLPGDDHFALANVSESLGAKYYEGGWLERAMEPTLAARGHYQAMGSLYSELFTRFHEARIRWAQGRLNDAVAVLATARSDIEANFGGRSDLAANCAAFEAETLYDRDRGGEALALLDWAMPHMEQSDGWVDVYAAAYFTAARVAAGDDALDEARGLLERARATARTRCFRQLELLADLCELELLLRGDAVEAARTLAEAIGLDALADAMIAESPLYRPVATAAALCRATLRLLDGDTAAALDELALLERYARQHGAGRLLIDLNLLRAFGYGAAGDVGRAQRCFDDAVGTAMFQGIVRPFVDARRFIAQPLAEALGAPGIDRFRAQFLKSIARPRTRGAPPRPAPDRLSDAEAAILRHLSQGFSNKEIARLIGMSPDTVKYRLKSVFRKIGVTKRRDAVRVSQERGLIAGGDVAAATDRDGDDTAAD